ncbi:MAG: Smr/MutS family protein [Bacteroidia bacterium]|jgi:hypothetical protein|nr:Smr/MutS family protein [Bacteroidia bacterium]
MINLGDKVRFLNENMEGIVTSIKGKSQIGVTIDSDFEIPVLISEVVKVKFEDSPKTKQDSIESKPFRVANSNPLGVFFAFEREGDTDLNCYIHNNLSESLIVLVYHKNAGVFHLHKKFQLERDETKFYEKVKLNQFDEWPIYQFVLLPIESTCINTANSISAKLSFGAKTFHQYWKHCFFLSKQAYVFRLDEQLDKLNLQALKSKDFSEKILAEPINLNMKPERIIDLHYEALQANGYGSSSDITGFQMEVFTKTLEAAFVNHLEEIIYIHGIGNAYLKNKIRTYLTKHPEMIVSFNDADSIQFGGGATLVRLK